MFLLEVITAAKAVRFLFIENDAIKEDKYSKLKVLPEKIKKFLIFENENELKNASLLVINKATVSVDHVFINQLKGNLSQTPNLIAEIDKIFSLRSPYGIQPIANTSTFGKINYDTMEETYDDINCQSNMLYVKKQITEKLKKLVGGNQN